MSKLPPKQRPPAISGRKRPRPEQEDGDPPESLDFQGRDDDVNARPREIPPGNGQIHYPAPDIGNQSAPQSREDIFRPLPSVLLPQPAESTDRSSVRFHAIFPPKTDGERTPTLTEVNPDSGSITGGVRIWLKGMDFPALLPLFARFGVAVVPTVHTFFYLSRSVSSCWLEFLFFQPSCLSLATHEQPRRHQCYAIEVPGTKCTRIWNQYRNIQIQRGS